MMRFIQNFLLGFIKVCGNFAVGFMLLVLLAGAADAEDIFSGNIINVELTQDEKLWIREHPVIRLGVDPGFAPFEFFSEKRVYEGIAAEYVASMGRSLGLKFETVPGLSWKDVVETARQGKIDVLPCIGITEERKDFLSYSKPYLVFPRVIIVQNGSAIASLKDLNHKTVGVQINSSHDGFIKEETDYRPVNFETFQDALQSLSRGEIDAVIGNMAVATYNIRKYNLTNLKIAAHASKKISVLAFGVRKDWPVLRRLIDKFLEALPENKKIEMNQKWMPGQALQWGTSDGFEIIPWTQEETQFLQEHPEIRVGIDPAYPPFEWIDNKGRHQGISSDYLRLLEKRMGVSFKVVPFSSWSEVIEGARDRDIDVVTCISETPQRKHFLKFTRPYLSFPVVIFTRTRMPFIAGLRDLKGKKVSLVREYAPSEVIQRDYPELTASYFDSPLEGLKSVSSGDADAYIGNLAVCIYLMQEHNITNLKVAAPAEGVASSELGMGVRSDLPLLVTILDKALQSITKEEQSAIAGNWISVRFEHMVDWGRVTRVAIIFIIVGLVIHGFFLYWNRKLAKEVTIRKQIESELEKAKDKAEKALEDLKTAQQHLIQSEKMTALGVLVAGIVHEINNPVNFIKTSILGLEQDIRDLEKLLDEVEKSESACNDSVLSMRLKNIKEDIDYPVLISEIPELVKSIFEGVRRTQDIIGSLRTYSRMDDAITDKKDIHELIGASLVILKSRYKNEIELKKAYTDVPEILLNSGKIIQVFINIISNAIDAVRGKYPAGEGSILIQTGLQTLNGREYVLVEIIDNGTGIPDAVKGKVFDPFFTTKDVGKGNGLGLSISIGIIEEHGGKIRINSEMNSGTTVSVFLPVEHGVGKNER